MKLKDKVAIITGAGQGIGREYALRFAEEGATVVIADIIPGNARKVAEEVKAKGGEGMALQVDVSKASSVMEMAEETAVRYKKIDVLLNNAALYGTLGVKRWDSWTEEEWERSFAINVIGSWQCIKAVVPHMKTRGKGKIINVGSVTYDLGFYAMMPYTCTKGAVVALTRTAARALGRYNITVNCLSPGFTLSDASLEMSDSKRNKIDEAFQGRCFRRHMYPKDLAGTAVFLASEDSDSITGQTIRVEGGEIMV